MKKYKLTTQDVTTHNGFQWEIGKKYEISTPGTALCSPDVFHFYDTPELAVILNSIHANIQAERLWEISCDQVSHDGLKGGAKWMTLNKELSLPQISIFQRVAFSILCAKDLAQYNDPDWLLWADKWLTGEDRSAAAAAKRAARAAKRAARAAKRAARAAKSAESAAWAAKRAASTAERAAEISQTLQIIIKKAMKIK